MKTFSENKAYLQNKYMANLQQYKSAVESIGLWKSLGDKENELKAIVDVLRYCDEKEVPEQQIRDLEDSMIPALSAYRKRKSRLNCLLSSAEQVFTKKKAAKVTVTDTNTNDDECVVIEKELPVEKIISSDNESAIIIIVVSK